MQVDAVFNYNVVISDEDISSKCDVNSEEAKSWFVSGGSNEDLFIPLEKIETFKVEFKIPEDVNPCTFRTKIVVNSDKGFYDSEIMDIQIID